MGKFVLQNVRLFTGGADLTTRTNQLEVVAERETKEVTAFAPSGDVWAESLAGLASTSLSAQGQWEAGDAGMVDDRSWSDLGATSAWTMCPAGAADGALAYFTSVLRGQYSLGAPVGDVAPWTANGSGTWPLVRGLLVNPPGTARTATGSGTAHELGAVGSGQQLYAALHVLSVAGTTPSITVKIQSDDAAGFASPTDRITFTAATEVGAQISRLAGPITDTHYRATWTISGTGPSFLAAVAVGIA